MTSATRITTRGQAIFVSVFGLLFLAVGLFVIGREAAQTIGQVRSLSWDRVDANFDTLHVAEHKSSKGNTLFDVVAKYRYSYAGHEYEGNRFSFSSGSDSSRSDKVSAVEAVRAEPKVWVNPANPAESVVWRENLLPPWLLPFGLTFTIAGVITTFVGPASLRARGRRENSWKQERESCIRVSPAIIIITATVLNFACTFLCLGVASVLSSTWSLAVLGAANVLGLALAALYWFRKHRLLNCVARFTNVPESGRSVSCTLAMDHPDANRGDVSLKVKISRPVRAGRTTSTYATYTIAEIPFNVTSEGYGRFSCFISRENHEKVNEVAGQAPVGIPGESRQVDDESISQYVRMALRGEKPLDESQMELMAASKKELQTNVRILSELVLQVNNKTISAQLVPAFWGA
jgi:hypothetical protein